MPSKGNNVSKQKPPRMASLPSSSVSPRLALYRRASGQSGQPPICHLPFAIPLSTRRHTLQAPAAPPMPAWLPPTPKRHSYQPGATPRERFSQYEMQANGLPHVRVSATPRRRLRSRDCVSLTASASHFAHELFPFSIFSPHLGQVHIESLDLIVHHATRILVVGNTLHYPQDYL
jgi:hypothetical protein